MGEDDRKAMLETLREIRDGQREIVRLLASSQSIAEEQLRKSRETISESVGLQRLALKRQRTVTMIAIPGIALCIGAIAYLILRYF